MGSQKLLCSDDDGSTSTYNLNKQEMHSKRKDVLKGIEISMTRFILTSEIFTNSMIFPQGKGVKQMSNDFSNVTESSYSDIFMSLVFNDKIFPLNRCCYINIDIKKKSDDTTCKKMSKRIHPTGKQSIHYLIA